MKKKLKSNYKIFRFNLKLKNKYKERIQEVLDQYKEEIIDFEDARDLLHKMGPDAFPDMLYMAESSDLKHVLEVIVMVLADKDYPPSLPFMVKCISHSETEWIAVPAAMMVDEAYNKKFGAEALYDDWSNIDGIFNGILKAWNSGDRPKLPSVLEWYEKEKKIFSDKKSAITPDQTGLDQEETQKWSAFMDKHDLSWCNWSVVDKRETCAALKPGASNRGRWREENVSPSGTLVRAAIRKSRR